MHRLTCLVIGLLLAACVPVTPHLEAPAEVATVAAVRPSPQSTPTSTPTTPLLPSPTPTPWLPETATKPAIPQTAYDVVPLPRQERMTFSIMAQYGGVPQAVAEADGLAYVGFGPRLVVVDISNPDTPIWLGQSDILPDAVQGIAIQNGLAFVGNGRYGLAIFDVTNPANPTEVGRWLPPDALNGSPVPILSDVMLTGSRAYVLSEVYQPQRSRSLMQFDLSSPTAPQLVDNTPLVADAHVVVREDGVFLVGNGRFQVRQSSQPAEILADIPLTNGSYDTSLFVHEDRVYVLYISPSGVSGYQLYDISTPSRPAPQGEFVPLSPFTFGPNTASNTLLVTAETFGEFGFCGSVLYLSPLNPNASSGLGGEFQPKGCLHDMVLQDNLLLIAGTAGLEIYDLGDPANPVLRSQVQPAAALLDARSVTSRGNVIYVLTSEGDGAQIKLLDFGGVPAGAPISFVDNAILDLHAFDNLLLAPLWNGGFGVLDISQPASPLLQYAPNWEDGLAVRLGAIAYANKHAYGVSSASNLLGSFVVVDFSDPSRPQEVAIVETGGISVQSLAAANGRLYVLYSGNTAMVQVYDIQIPAQPQLIGEVALPSPPEWLTVIDNVVYALCRFTCRSMTVIDVADAAQPQVLAQWGLPAELYSLTPDAYSKLLYLHTSRGIYVLDVSQPAQPVIVGYTAEVNGRITLDAYGDLLIAAGALGLYHVDGAMP